jgi:hypothetical protein
MKAEEIDVALQAAPTRSAGPPKQGDHGLTGWEALEAHAPEAAARTPGPGAGAFGRHLRGMRIVESAPTPPISIEEHHRRNADNWRIHVEAWRHRSPLNLPGGFGWATYTNPEFAQIIRGKRLLRAGQKWQPGPANLALVLSAATGEGKTAVACAVCVRLRSALVDGALEVDASNPYARREAKARFEESRRWHFVTGFELAQARRQASLGTGEAPAIQKAMKAPLLVLDEVGHEPQTDPVIFEVADARYRNGLPTIVTTGLRPAQFRDRYGDATWRRFTERGALVQEWDT